jgi:hypothetical protein
MKKDLQQLLQECLQGYDAGLSPEECLSAYPQARAELEPLLRQALSLRVAYAASPSQEFKFRAREKLLFHAGRDVRHALSAEPDPNFVNTTRQRLLNRAGANEQEALRAVPPPRLPFWVNARRHLLENASANPPRPAPQVAMVMRTAISAAVVVLAVAVAGAGFLLQNSPANEPPRTALGEEIDSITNQITTFEQQKAAGQEVSSSQLSDLAERTSQVAEQAVADNANSELLDKLPDLIDRQLDLAEATPPDESIAQAQANLAAADQRVAAAASPVVEPTNTSVPAAATSATPAPTVVESTPEPTATQEATPEPEGTPADPEELAARELVLQAAPDEGDDRQRLTMNSLTFVMPDTWSLWQLDVDDDGHAVLPSDLLFVQTDIEGFVIAIRTEGDEAGEVMSIDPPYTLRTGGIEGVVAAPTTVAGITGGDPNSAGLYEMLTSLEVFDADAEPTPTATPDTTEEP